MCVYQNLQGGLIELVIIEGRDLVAADIRGTSDPYVRVHYGSERKRTKVMIICISTFLCFLFILSSNHRLCSHPWSCCFSLEQVHYKTLTPQWHQTFQFPDDGSLLALHVKDHNALLPTSSIGDCIVEGIISICFTLCSFVTQ